MLDLLSTRQTTDQQTAACARLLAAVISQAVADACKRPLSSEKRARRNIDGEASEAIHFLFGDGPEFAVYAKLIGLSAPSIRCALTSDVKLKQGKNVTFSDSDRRRLNLRKRWYTSSKQAIKHATRTV